MGCLKWMTIGVLNTDKIEPRGAPFRRRCGSFTVKDLYSTDMTQMSTEKSFKWHPFITFNTKNVFYLIPTKISKISTFGQKFHASEQNERTIFHASKRTIFHERTNDRALS